MTPGSPESKPRIFGNRPYRPCSYFSVIDAPDGSEIEDLLYCLSSLKAGDLTALEKCEALISSDDVDVRLYASQLFASACNHQQVEAIAKGLEHFEDWALEWLIVLLGHSLSPQGLVEILNFREALGDDFLDETIHSALAYQLGETLPDTGPRIEVDRIRQVVDQLQTNFPHAYLYSGTPVSLGKVADRMLTKVEAFSRRDIVLFGEDKILQEFSGIECPIQSGSFVACETLDEVFAYLKGIGQASQWVPGTKYFWRHPVST